MNSEDRTALWAVASAIAFPIVGDRARADDLTRRSLAWLDDQPGAADAPVPWLASHVVSQAIVDRPGDGRSHDARRAHLAAALRAEPVAAQVAFAVRVLCGYDLATTAALCRRPKAEIETLLEPLAAASVGVAELVDPGPAGSPSTAALQPSATTGPLPTATTSPGGAPPAPSPRDRRNGVREAATEQPAPPAGKRRWFKPGGGTVATVLLVVASVAVVTYPGGTRPSFAAPSKAAACSTSGGPGTAKTVALGPSGRSARLFIPSGAGLGRAVMLLIGDNGQSAENTVATTGMESAAATQGFVLVTLDGSKGPWNAGVDPSALDDLSYATAAIDRAAAHGCADKSLLSIVGYGTGAHMAATVACDPGVHAHQLIMVRGTYLPPTCQPQWPISVLIDTDQTDRTLPNDGSWGTVTPVPGYTPTSLDDTFRGWSDLEGCATTSSAEAAPGGIVITERSGCAAGAQVVTRTSSGKGHDWPPEAVGAAVRFAAGD